MLVLVGASFAQSVHTIDVSSIAEYPYVIDSEDWVGYADGDTFRLNDDIDAETTALIISGTIDSCVVDLNGHTIYYGSDSIRTHSYGIVIASHYLSVNNYGGYIDSETYAQYWTDDGARGNTFMNGTIYQSRTPGDKAHSSAVKAYSTRGSTYHHMTFNVYSMDALSIYGGSETTIHDCKFISHTKYHINRHESLGIVDITAGGYGCSPTMIYNNEFYGGPGHGIMFDGSTRGGIVEVPTSRHQIYNNYFEMTSDITNGFAIGIYTREVDIYNNIIRQRVPEGRGTRAVKLGAQQSRFYNNYIETLPMGNTEYSGRMYAYGIQLESVRDADGWDEATDKDAEGRWITDRLPMRPDSTEVFDNTVITYAKNNEEEDEFIDPVTGVVYYSHTDGVGGAIALTFSENQAVGINIHDNELIMLNYGGTKSSRSYERLSSTTYVFYSYDVDYSGSEPYDLVFDNNLHITNNYGICFNHNYGAGHIPSSIRVIEPSVINAAENNIFNTDDPNVVFTLAGFANHPFPADQYADIDSFIIVDPIYESGYDIRDDIYKAGNNNSDGTVNLVVVRTTDIAGLTPSLSFILTSNTSGVVINGVADGSGNATVELPELTAYHPGPDVVGPGYTFQITEHNPWTLSGNGNNQTIYATPQTFTYPELWHTNITTSRNGTDLDITLPDITDTDDYEDAYQIMLVQTGTETINMVVPITQTSITIPNVSSGALVLKVRDLNDGIPSMWHTKNIAGI